MEKKCKIIYLNNFIYILSDDEIKEGDWCLDTVNNILFISDGNSKLHKSTDKKIIATTDTSLLLHSDFDSYNLPQPSQQFIEKYIESYNKGEIITDVLVEYEENKPYQDNQFVVFYDDVKINPKDNTITINKLKDSWNREELKVLFKKHEKDVIKYINGSGASATPSFNDKWIKENL